jgi:hypothetical protein
MTFSGSNYSPELDKERLTNQLSRICELMMDGKFRTVKEIADITGDPETSVSAQLRNLRKEKFGGYQVPKQRRGEKKRGLWEFQLLPPLDKWRQEAPLPVVFTEKEQGQLVYL